MSDWCGQRARTYRILSAVPGDRLVSGVPTDREIERKYLLRGMPDLPAGTPSAELDQGYLPGTKIQERVRRVRSADGVRYYRTVKMGKGVDRLEFEEETTEAFFDAVWPLTEGQRVLKRRFRASTPGGTWEVDQFLDRELVLAEIELESVDQRIDMPEFISAQLVRDVTDEEPFTNFRLSR